MSAKLPQRRQRKFKACAINKKKKKSKSTKAEKKINNNNKTLKCCKPTQFNTDKWKRTYIAKQI